MASPTESYFPTILETKNPRSRGCQVWFLRRPLSGLFLFFLFFPPPGLYSLFSHRRSLLLTRTPAQLDQYPTLMTSFHLNYLSKHLVSRCWHIGGQGLHLWILAGYNTLMVQLVKILPAVQETWIWSSVGKIPGEGKGYPLQYSGLENSMDHISPWGHKESNMTEWFSLDFHYTLCKTYFAIVQYCLLPIRIG